MVRRARLRSRASHRHVGRLARMVGAVAMTPLGNYPQEITEPRILRHRITDAQIGLLLCVGSAVVMIVMIALAVAWVKGWV